MGAFFSLRETLPPDQAEPLWRHVTSLLSASSFISALDQISDLEPWLKGPTIWLILLVLLFHGA
jgi:hypothetical protein